MEVMSTSPLAAVNFLKMDSQITISGAKMDEVTQYSPQRTHPTFKIMFCEAFDVKSDCPRVDVYISSSLTGRNSRGGQRYLVANL